MLWLALDVVFLTTLQLNPARHPPSPPQMRHDEGRRSTIWRPSHCRCRHASSFDFGLPCHLDATRWTDNGWWLDGGWKELVERTRNQKQPKTMVVNGMRLERGPRFVDGIGLIFSLILATSHSMSQYRGEARPNLRFILADSEGEIEIYVFECFPMLYTDLLWPICLRFRKNIVGAVWCLRKNQCKMTKGQYFRRCPLNSWPRLSFHETK